MKRVTPCEPLHLTRRGRKGHLGMRDMSRSLLDSKTAHYDVEFISREGTRLGRLGVQSDSADFHVPLSNDIIGTPYVVARIARRGIRIATEVHIINHEDRSLIRGVHR